MEISIGIFNEIHIHILSLLLCLKNKARHSLFSQSSKKSPKTSLKFHILKKKKTSNKKAPETPHPDVVPGEPVLSLCNSLMFICMKLIRHYHTILQAQLEHTEWIILSAQHELNIKKAHIVHFEGLSLPLHLSLLKWWEWKYYSTASTGKLGQKHFIRPQGVIGISRKQI